MNDDFYVVLPSSSSKFVFPDNVATHFTTQLPQNFCLHGDWCVGLTEIQIPHTFQHISVDESEGIVCIRTSKRSGANDLRPEMDKETFGRIKSGVYCDVSSLLQEINNLSNVKDHLQFEIQSGGYVQVRCLCTKDCPTYSHTFILSEKLVKILGLERSRVISCDGKRESYIIGNRPANLANGLPAVLMVYSNICQPYVTGDVRTSLLRAVSLNLRDYVYGGVEIKNFSPPMYLPLLSSSFQSIEIDIRSEHGLPIPFDYGTLTVTLHFKRIR